MLWMWICASGTSMHVVYLCLMSIGLSVRCRYLACVLKMERHDWRRGLRQLQFYPSPQLTEAPSQDCQANRIAFPRLPSVTDNGWTCVSAQLTTDSPEFSLNQAHMLRVAESSVARCVLVRCNSPFISACWQTGLARQHGCVFAGHLQSVCHALTGFVLQCTAPLSL